MGTELKNRLDDDLAALLASDPAAIADPYSTWDRVREEDPVHAHGPVVLLTRFEHVKPALADNESYSHAGRSQGSRAKAIEAGLTTEQALAYRDITDFENLYLSRSDGPDHERRRRIAHRTFTPKRIAELDAATYRYAEEMIATTAAGDSGDLMSGLAYHLPLMLICDLLGVPAPDRERIHEWSGALGRNRGGDDPTALMAAHGALDEFRAFVKSLLVKLRKERGTDLLSALLDAEDDERLTEEELAAMFVVLLFAGHETTTNLIATGLLMLLEQRDQWERLCAEPELVPNAVEELLRIVTPVQWQFRLSRKEIEVGGVQIPAGQTVYPVVAAANRDPEVFAEPARLDIGRDNAKAHLALGYGSHFCLGNALARLEGRVVLELLSAQYPDLALAASPEELRWRGHAMLRGLAELPVDFGPRRG
jgi:cytochrome P450